MKFRIFLYLIALVSVIATAFMANMDYNGKMYEWCMARHLRWQTWVCFAVCVTSYAWAEMRKK
jgi:hypothetical protein